jgi:hypothetical protein
MHPTNCLNCGTILTADDKFCPTCGQKTDIHRITLKHIFHEFFHSFTHADKGFLGMIADLAVKPGIVAREYVAGKRKKYFNPFTFFILCLGLLVFTNNIFKSVAQDQHADPRVLAQLPTEKQKRSYVKLIDRVNEGTEIGRHHLNFVFMIPLPFYALVVWLFFKRRGYNYSEVMVAYMMFLSFATFIMTLFVYTWVGRFQGQPLYFYGVLGGKLLEIIYAGWALYIFFGFKNKWSIISTSAVCLLNFVLWVVVVTLALLYYVFRSNTGTVLQKIWQEYF